jgi:hypothetical protein
MGPISTSRVAAVSSSYIYHDCSLVKVPFDFEMITIDLG